MGQAGADTVATVTGKAGATGRCGAYAVVKGIPLALVATNWGTGTVLCCPWWLGQIDWGRACPPIEDQGGCTRGAVL